MSRIERAVLIICAGLVGFYFAWQLTSQTVIAVINANVAAQQLAMKLQACEAKGK